MHEKKMTDTSLLMFEKATSGYLTLTQAVDELKNTSYIRTVKDVLAEASGIAADEKSRLHDFLVSSIMKTDPNANKDSVARKVRTWLSGEVRSVSKDSAILLSFALKLDMRQANDLLLKLCEEGFHWRDPQDIVFAFALDHSMNYYQASELYKSIEGTETFSYEEDPDIFTADVEYEMRYIDTEEELRQYILSHSGRFGKMHNTAFSVFSDLIDILVNPYDGDIFNYENVSVRDIASNNLYAYLIPRNRRADDQEKEPAVFSVVQKNIRDNWPDETTLSKMINRKTDITRKVLILLFLATDGGESDYGDWNDEEQSTEEIFEDRYERMKEMLIDCGFSPLDPRSSFDWMIMYCMCADDSFIIDEQMQGFITAMFY